MDVTNGDSVSNATVNTLRLNAATDVLTLGGVNTVNSSGVLATATTTSGTVTGGVLTMGSGREMVLIDNGNLTVNSNIGDNSFVSLTLAGTGTTTLAGTYEGEGTTSILNGSTVKLGTSTILGVTGALGNGLNSLNLASGSTLNLNGNNLVLGAVGTNGSLAVTPTITNTSATTGTLVVGNNNGSLSSLGSVAITGNIALVVTGNSANNINIFNPSDSFTGGVTFTNNLTGLGSGMRFTNGTTLGTGPIGFGGYLGVGGVFLPSSGISNYGSFANAVTVNGGSMLAPNLFTAQANPGTVGFTATSTWTGSGVLELFSGFSPTFSLGGNMTGFSGTIFDSDTGANTNFSNGTNIGMGNGVLDLSTTGSSNITVQYTGGGNVTVPFGDLNTTGNTSSGTLKIQNGTANTTANFQVGGLNLSSAFNGIIATNGTDLAAVTKTGTGIWTLGGANTYTAGTTISAGGVVTTNATSLGTGTVSVANGASLINEISATGSLTTGALTLANGAIVGDSVNTSSVTNNGIAAAGTASTTGAYTVEIVGTGATAASGAQTLLSAGGGLTGGTASLVVMNSTNFTVSGFTQTATSVSATITGGLTTPTTEYWNGGFSGGNNIWAISNGSSSSNWVTTLGGTATSLTPGATTTINFSDTTPANSAASTTLGANMNVAGIVVSDANGVGLNYDGHSLTIGTGGITMNSGAGAASLNAPITLGGAESWANNSANTLTVGSSTSPITTGGNLLTFNGSGATVVSGAINGASGVTQSGTGITTLAGNNGFTGTVTVSSGTLALSGNNSGRGQQGTSGLTVVNNGGTLQLQATSGNTLNGYSLALSGETFGNSPLTLNSGATVRLLSNSNVTFDGGNSLGGLGNASVTFFVGNNGSGSNNTIGFAPNGFSTSNTTINVTGANGDLLALGPITNTAANTTTFNPTTGSISIGGLFASAATTYVLGGTSTGNVVQGEIDQGSSTIGITKNSASTWTLAGNNIYSGATSVSAGTLNLTGSLDGGTAITVSGGLFAESSAGAIGGAAQSLAVSGGTATLAGNNGYTGSTTLTSGQLNVNSSTALGTGTLGLNGGTIDNTGGSAVTSQLNNPAISIGANFAYGGTQSLNLGTGAITGSTAETIALGGSGKTLTLGGTWTNSTDATNTLTVSGASNTLALGGLALDGSGTTSRTQTIAGTGNVTIGQITNGASTGTQSLVYAGTGTLSVNGTTATSLLAGIAVNSGVFQADESNIVGNTNVLASTSTVTLNGGTFAVTGGSQTLGNLALTAGTLDTVVLNEGSASAANLTATSLTGGGSANLYLNLANAGTGVFLTNLTASTIEPWSVVQDSTGVGIGTTNASKDLVRLAASPLTSTSNSASTNFTTTGSAAPTVTNSVGSSSLETLFIDAGATSSGTTTTWDLGGSANTVSIAQGVIAMAGANNFTIQDGNLKASQATTSSLTLNNEGSGTLTVSANIVNGSGNSTLTTYGNLTLAGANTFTGVTTIDTGYVRAGVSTIQGTSGAFGNGNQALTISNGTLDLNGFNVGLGVLTASNNSVILNNSGSGTSTLTIDNGGTTTGSLTGTSTIQDHTTGNGAVAVVVNGGTLTVSSTGSSTFSGGLTLTNGGTFVVKNGSAGGPDAGAGMITFNGGTINVQSASLINRTFAQNIQINNVAGNQWTDGNNQGGETFTGTWTGTGTIAIVNAFSNQTMNFQGNMTGFAGTFDTSTDGTGTVTGNNHFLTLSNSVNVGISNAKLILAGGGSSGLGTVTLQWGGTGSQTIGIGELTSTGGVGSATDNTTLGIIRNTVAGTTATWSVGSLNTSDAYAGTIINGTGTSALTKVGSGTLTLTNGGNSYTGTTTVSAGGLALATSGTLSGTTALVVNSGASFSEDSVSGVTSSAALTIAGTANLNGANANVTTSTITSTGVINLGNGVSNTESLAGSIADNGLFSVNGGSTALNISNVITGTGSVALASQTTGNNFGNSSNAYGGGTSVTAGQWSANTGAFGTGGLVINPTGAVNVEVDSTGGSIASGANVTINNGAGSVTGKLVLNETAQTFATLNGNGSLVLNNGGNGSLLTIGNNSTNSTFSGVISDGNSGDNAHGSAILKMGTDTLTLSGSNSFDNIGGNAATNSTEVQQGVLNIQNGWALGYDTTTGGFNGNNLAQVDSGATLQLQGGITVTANPLTISGSGAAGAAGALENVSGNNAYDAGITLAGATTFASDSGTLTINSTANSTVPSPGILGGSGNLTLVGAGSGVITDSIQTGASGLTMNSAGTWTLGGANTYTGPTSLNAGKTILTGSIASGSTVTVGNGTAAVAILSGTGTVSGSLVTTAASGGDVAYLAPGLNTGGTRGDFGSAGTLHVGGSLTLGTGTNLDFDLSSSGLSGNDQIAVGGTLSIGTALTVNVNELGASLDTANKYQLITFTGSAPGLGGVTFTTTGTGSYTAVYSIDGGGEALDVAFSLPATTPAAAFFNGQGTDLGAFANFDTTVSSGTAVSAALGSTTNVSFNANRDTTVSTATLNTALDVNSVTFGTGSGINSGMTINGTGTLTVEATTANGNTIGNGITVATGGGSNTINTAVALDNDQTWTATDSTSTLTLGGQVSGAHMLSTAGSGVIALNNATGNSYSGGTSVGGTSTVLLGNSSNSATGSGALTVNGGATIGGHGISSGTGFAINGSGTTSTTRANVLVGKNSLTSTNTTQVLTLIGSTGTSTIANANLSFNINAQVAGALGSNPAGSGTELSVAATNITFGSAVASVQLTLNVQNEPAIVAAYTPYVLIAGTGVTTDVGGVSGGQYTGLTLGTVTNLGGGATETIITGNNLQLAFGSAIDTSYYGANSYLVLYQSSGVDDIDVVVVPEPSTWALMIGGLALLVFWQRRRNKNSL